MSKATENLLEAAKAIVDEHEELQILIESLEDLGSLANGGAVEYKELKAAMAAIEAEVITVEADTIVDEEVVEEIAAEEVVEPEINDEDIYDDLDEAKSAIAEAKDQANDPELKNDPEVKTPKTPKVSKEKTVTYKKLIKNPVNIGFETYHEDEIVMTAAEAKQNAHQIKRSIELGMIE